MAIYSEKHPCNKICRRTGEQNENIFFHRNKTIFLCYHHYPRALENYCFRLHIHKCGGYDMPQFMKNAASIKAQNDLGSTHQKDHCIEQQERKADLYSQFADFKPYQ